MSLLSSIWRFDDQTVKVVEKRCLCYDAQMQIEDILRLSRLSRIRITNEEAESLRGDIESVLAYVSDINAITADSAITKKVGAVYNVFREDVVTNVGDTYTESILTQAPKIEGRHVLVKKIIQQD